MIERRAALAVMAGLGLQACAASGRPENRLVEVASFGRRQPVGITVSETGRMFVTFPRQSGSAEFRYALAEMVRGEEVPYPDAAWNSYTPADADNHFMNVQAAIAQGDVLWVLDAVQPFGSGTPSASKLMKVGLSDNKVQRIYRFEDIAPGTAALNDVRVDARRNLAYLSDPKRSAIVILDLTSGRTRTVLEGSRPTSAAPGFVLHIDGQDVMHTGGRPFVSNANGIALTHDGRWFYFRAINQENLYRIETRHLADVLLSDAELLAQVQDLGKVGVSHGMLADKEGNIYLSDSIHYAINRWSPDGRVTRLVQDPRLSWPDTFAIGPDGTLYVTAAQINRTAAFNAQERVEYPYRLYKVVH